jgi:hypothetical protein
VDRYAGINDPVELLHLMHTQPEHDPLVNLLPPPCKAEDLYAALTEAQAQRLMRIATELLAGNADAAEEIGLCLGAFTGFSLDPMLSRWLDQASPYPALMFRGAGAKIRDRLFKLLAKNPGLLPANEALSALAWIGDDATARFLNQAEVDRPKWSRELFVGPAAYAHTAGWELINGRRRELTPGLCIALHVIDAGRSGTDRVQVMRPRPDTCPWCGRALVDLLNVDLSAPLFAALSPLGQHIEVVTCPVCTCFGHVHAELDAAGLGHWAQDNAEPKFSTREIEWGEIPWTHAAVTLAPRRPTHGADWYLPTTFSQIGGFPAWIQDLEYPQCLKCKQTMVFLAQIDQAVFEGEGIYYAFICPDCRTTATVYQQS